MATRRRHAAEDRRAFGTPHRAGLMSRSVRLTFFRAASCPFDYEPSLERPSFSLARSIVHAPRAFRGLLFSLSLSLAHLGAFHPTRAHSLLSLSRSFSPSGRQSPLQRPFLHPLAPGVPLLSSVMSSTCRTDLTRFYLRPILSAGLSTRRSNLNREKIARRNFLRIQHSESVPGYRISWPTCTEFYERTSPDAIFASTRVSLYRATFREYVF